MPNRRAVLLPLVIAVGLVGGEAAKPPGVTAGLVRIGDVGSVPDPSRYDERFPEMAEWSKAGVEGGVPEVERVVGVLKPGDDLAAAIAAADVAPGRLGVLLLRSGTYDLKDGIRLKPGLVLRGADRATTVLAFALPKGVGVTMAEWSALEDLTALNSLVKAVPESEYVGTYKNGGPSDACTVWFGGSNSWLQRCDLTHAGKNPLEIHNHKVAHVTVRDCLIDKAYNKGGGGAGYVDISSSKHVLFYNNHLRDIRHLSIMFGAQYVVVYGCLLEVDLNYHDGCPSHILAEKLVIRRKSYHHWPSICYGWEPWQDDGPGPRCILWDNQVDNGDANGSDKVYVLRDTTAKYKNMKEIKPMTLDLGGPPKHGTLYAVTGKHLPLEEVQKGKVFAKLQTAYAAKAWPDVVVFAQTTRRLFKDGDAQHAQAGALLSEAERVAAEALAKVAAKPTPPALRAFAAAHAGTSAAGEAGALAAKAAGEAWARLTAAGAAPTATALRAFLADWNGVAPVDAALAKFDELATADLARQKDRLTSSAALTQFQRQWPGTTAAGEAEAVFTAKLRTALDALVARKAQLTPQQREGYAAQFAGTPLEAAAKKELLGK